MILSDNEISCDAGHVFAYVFNHNTALKHLNLNSNKLVDNDADLIANSLSTKSCIETLKLQRNHFSEEMKQKIVNKWSDVGKKKANLFL